MSLDVQLVGNAMQMAIITLQPGQVVYSEAGKFLFSSGDVSMETKFNAPGDEQHGSGRGGTGAGGMGGSGALGGLLRTAMNAGQRMLAGESLALNHYSTRGGDGLLALAGVIPGEMRSLELDGGTTWMAEKDAFVAAEAGVRMSVQFAGFGTGMRGGEGMILEKFTGQGTLLIAGAGNFIDVNPADYGGMLKIDTGCIVAFEDTLEYNVERVGAMNRQGLMNAFLGGEGMSLATLQGNGRCILQSMTLAGLATALAKNASHNDRGDTNGQTGFGALGGLFGGSQS